LTDDDINKSFFNGMNSHSDIVLDSDDSDYVEFTYFDYLLSKPPADHVIISKDNTLYKYWCALELILCLLSSYYYAYLATFLEYEDTNEVVDPIGNNNKGITLFFELYFAISIGLKFFLEYDDDNSPLPVRNLSKIADRYLKGDFI